MWPSDVFWVSRRYARRAPAACTSTPRSSMPNPASVFVLNWSNSVVRACSGWKSHDGRTVSAIPDWLRNARTQGASELSSDIKISAGLSLANSSISSCRMRPVKENRPVESSTQDNPSFPPASITAAR